MNVRSDTKPARAAHIGPSTVATGRVTFLGIGEPVPFPFLGTTISLMIFILILVIVTGLKDILEAQDVFW